MGFAEKRGSYWRGRYKIELGKYGTVSDEAGVTIRFTTKRLAKQAADEAESTVRQGTWRDLSLGRMTFGEYASRWYAAQDLAASTMQNYRRHIEEHLLPTFETTAVADIRRDDINAWERREKEHYAISSVKTWRSTLHLIFEDAIDEGLITTNPAAKRRGRGKRAGRSANRGPEKVVTDPLGVLLIAERAALLSGRDDEFVASVLKGYTGIRWGEIVGLETKFVRPTTFRIEWQLYELDSGEFVRCPPKDDSYRTVDSTPWLSGLVKDHVARTQPEPCPCHGRTYVFHGHGDARAVQQGASLKDVARRADVSTGTVSNVLNRPHLVREETRVRVEAAAAELGYARATPQSQAAPHWRRNGFSTWLFGPAVSGWYPKKAPQEARPVPVLSEPWPGIPVRGRNSQGRAEACWAPIQAGLTPHGLRHSHKTHMDELKTPKVLKDERMGHVDGSVSARYSHVTAGMREELIAGLTVLWNES
ncbi:tyrosine-type recombinase/integrase, partial [Streptomyces sp. AA1529]|uniref:tyrosine-type recombinase/integrase n=1 Tax=Streptomyces sp. AA1529 TaxID=1203257 RepID=UPI00036ABCCA